MNHSEILYFAGFIVFVAVMLALDLGIFNKRDHIIKSKEAMLWSGVWVTLALVFYGFLYKYAEKIHGIETIEELKRYVLLYGQKVKINPDDLEQSLRSYRSVFSLEYLTGYVIELSLSIDNIFIIILIFAAFKVQKHLYHRVLFWGILGAVVFRCIFIFAGSFLISRFSWILYVFAAFLIFTGVKMLLNKDEEEAIDSEKHIVVKWASRFFKVHPKFVENKFFTIREGKRYITPLFLVLLMIEFSDIIFAVDSIPAIFAVTKDPYIVFFSNIFAILGLRSMFFLLINVVDKFHFFKYGLSLLLIFIGLKMLLAEQLEAFGFTVSHSLIVILSILLGSVILSFLFPEKKK